MQSRHRRAPSAMPSLGFEEEIVEPTRYLAPALQVSLPRFQLPKTNEENNFKNSLKSTTTSCVSQNPQFSHNYSNSLFNELYRNDDSNEGSVKEISECIEVSELVEINSGELSENGMDELTGAMEGIMRIREARNSKEEVVKNNVKSQLMHIFKQEISDLDTDRRKDSVKCSEETIEGPGSSFNMDDFSLVKFEASLDKPEKKKKKTVKFKDI